MVISPVYAYSCNSRKMHYNSGKEGTLIYSIGELSNYFRLLFSNEILRIDGNQQYVVTEFIYKKKVTFTKSR